MAMPAGKPHYEREDFKPQPEYLYADSSSVTGRIFRELLITGTAGLL